TTTTSLASYIFTRAGRNTSVAGNIGFPFSDFALERVPEDVVVLEVSSFQLDHIAAFRPRVSVLLNITPDHLDRYDNDFGKYARSKFRILETQKDDDVLVYNHDDVLVREYVERITGQRKLWALGFSREQFLSQGAFVRDGAIVLRLAGNEEMLM